jgi:hypothetical protein
VEDGALNNIGGTRQENFGLFACDAISPEKQCLCQKVPDEALRDPSSRYDNRR